MKFKANTKKLIAALQDATAIVNDRVAIPIMKEVKFDLQNESLSLTSSDMQNTVVSQITVESTESGEFCLDAKSILLILKTLPDGQVELEVSDNRAKLISLVGVFEVPVSDAADYPKLPNMDKAESVTINSSILFEGISKTVAGVGVGLLRTFDYLLVQAGYKEIVFVGCDTNNLFEFKSDVDFDKSFSLLLDPKSANLIKSYADGNDVELSFTSSHVMIKTEKSSVYCRLGEGKYVDYTKVIPQDHNTYAIVDRVSLITAIKRGLVLANRTTSSILVDFESTSMTIKSEDTDFNTSAKEVVECSYVGDPMTIFLNGRKVIDSVNGIETDNVRIEVTIPSRPAVFRPEDATQYLGLTMPLNLKAN